MPAAVGDVYNVNVLGTIFSQRVMLTHHYIITAATAPPSEITLRNDFLTALRGGVGGGDAWETLFRDCMPTAYILEDWHVQMIRPIRLAYARANRSVPGLHMDDTEASNQAAVITLKSEFAGRWAQSNKHIGPIPQSGAVQSNGDVTPAYKAKLELLGAGLLSTIVVDTCTLQPCILHPVGVHGGTTPLLTQTIQPTLRVMRRRTVRLGE